MEACPFVPSPGASELLPENVEVWNFYQDSKVLGISEALQMTTLVMTEHEAYIFRECLLFLKRYEEYLLREEHSTQRASHG